MVIMSRVGKYGQQLDNCLTNAKRVVDNLS